MKSKIFFLLALLFSAFAYSQSDNKHQLELHSFKAVGENGLELATRLAGKNWRKDANGENDCALIRITFENMPLEQAKNVKYNCGPSAPIVGTENRLDRAEREIWLWVTPSTNALMEAQLDGYGISNRLSNLKLEPKHAYDVVLKNDKTVSINILTQPKGLTVLLQELGQKATTDATITDVPLGRHTLTISNNGKHLKDTVIEVSESSVKFEYDLREKKEITFKTKPSKADLYINGEFIGKTPLKKELAYDNYYIEAKSGEKATDSISLTINDLSPSVIELEPVRHKTFECIAMYNGHKVEANIFIDGRLEGQNQPAYTFTKPVGESYEIRMERRGDSETKKIRVSDNMQDEQIFYITPRNSFVWPWQREYDARPVGFSVNMVSKQLVTTGETFVYEENGIWDNGEGKWLYGVSMGLHLQPCFSFGLGLYTGLFGEMYFSFNSSYDYDAFSEISLYLPLHAYYRLPFAETVALSVHGGLGFSFCYDNTFSDSEGVYADVSGSFGGDAYPSIFNIATEIGAGLRIGSIELNIQYSNGIMNHHSYDYLEEELGENLKTTRNKLTFGISYLISGN